MRPITPATAHSTARATRVPEQQYHLRKVDPTLWRLVKVRAAQEGVPIRTVLMRALERYASGKP
jgi:hypothetical protein